MLILGLRCLYQPKTPAADFVMESPGFQLLSVKINITDYSERSAVVYWLQWTYCHLQWTFTDYSESYAEYSECRLWFQPYHPARNSRATDDQITDYSECWSKYANEALLTLSSIIPLWLKYLRWLQWMFALTRSYSRYFHSAKCFALDEIDLPHVQDFGIKS